MSEHSDEDFEALLLDLIHFTSYSYDCEAQQPHPAGVSQKIYQSIREMPGLLSTRNMEHRYAVMGLPLSFEGQRVLDLGCNLGRVCVDTVLRGAENAVGVDFNSQMIASAKRFLELRAQDLREPMERVQLHVADLNKGLSHLRDIIGDQPFDHCFALSIWGVVEHEKLWEIIRFYTKKVCWFEAHKCTGKYGDQSPSTVQKTLEQAFPTQAIRFLGFTDDDKGQRRANFKIYF